MKRVEMLEAKDSFKNVESNIHANTSVARHKSDGDFEIQNTSSKVRVPRHKPAADLEHGGVISADDVLQDMDNIPVMGTSPMHGDGFKQVLSDDDGLAASTVSWAAGLCVPRQKAVRELDFFDANPPACNRVETVPFRHVSFAKTVEMVEFDSVVHAAPPPVIEYNASAPNMAHRAHAAPAPMVEYDAALMMPHLAHVTPALMVEYDAAPTVAHWVHVAPATAAEYDASAARAAPSPWWTGQSSRSCMFLRCMLWRRQSGSRSCRLSRKSLIFQSVQSTQTSESLNIITPAPKEFVEAVLHEIDEELCRDDLGEICYVAGMSRKRTWRCVWHGRSTPEGLSAVIRSMRVSDEYVCGKWASEKGESSIFRECNMNCLSFEELVDDSGFLHGW